MTNFKFKSILAFAGMLAFLSLAMISCEDKTELQTSSEVQFDEVESKFYFTLPSELDNASKKEIEDFLENRIDEIEISNELDQSEISSRCGWIEWSCGENNWLCGTGTYKYLRVWKDTCTGRYAGACMSNCNVY